MGVSFLANLEYRFSKKGDDLAKVILDDVSDFQDYVINRGIAKQWIKNQDYIEQKFYESYEGDDIVDAGQQGEYKAMAFNHFRNIYKHMYNQVTANTPAYTCTATNTDLESKKSTQVGKRVVDYYHKVKRFEDYMNSATDKAIAHGDGYLVVEFDPTIGRKIGLDNKGKFIYEGDFKPTVRTVWDVFFDYNKESKKDWVYCTFRKRLNKFDVAATFPKHKDAIVGLTDYRLNDRYAQYINNGSDIDNKDSDDIFVYGFYHKESPALPNGKYCLVAGDCDSGSVMLYESDKNFYKDKLPVFPISPGEYLTDCFGFTDLNICRGPQELMNVILSGMASNAIASGSQNIWAGSPGNNIDIQTTVDGMNLFYSDQKPEVIDFYQENPGMMKLLGLCKSTMETLSGQNSVVRGDVAGAPNLKSGVAIATVINMALQFSMGLAKSYYALFEDVYSFMLDTLKSVANEQRLIEIVGKKREQDVEYFTKDDLKGISRVVVERVNPVSKSYSGSIEIGMELLQLGQITPEQFFDLINTGNIDFATENKERMMDLITAYKDGLLKGEQLPAIPGINHRLFMQEIQSLLFDKDIMVNPERANILQNILSLLTNQMNLVRGGDEIADYIYGGQLPMAAQQPPMGDGNIQALTDQSAKPQNNSAQPQAGLNLGGLNE